MRKIQMNEKIEDLLYHSGLTAQGCWDELGTYEQEAIEKFAELLVKECAQLARDTDLEDVEGGDSAVLHAASTQIKKHFGVEE
jgi:hypothetical protein